ncbi:ion transporter [Cytophagaceae bacterium ABcell3]|nr:ion transporter [Cytophagaceae bacterium ABcell3]
MTFRKKVFLVLEETTEPKSLSWYFDLFLINLIVLNVVAVILETVDGIYNPLSIFFTGFEYFSITFFAIEYLLRVWAIIESPKKRHPIKGRLNYMYSFLGIVDLLAFLPFFLPFLGIDFRFIRMLRLLRLFRLMKITRYFGTLELISNVVKNKRVELSITITLLALILIFTSSLMYFVEHTAQPEAFSSIPATMWWGVATLTTVGYGDMYPFTPLGRFLGAVIAVLGLGFFALPAGILSSGFAEEIKKRKTKPHKNKANGKCPHCGKSLKGQ